MYTPKYFEQHDIDEIKKTITGHPFATLVTSGADGVEANHLPFYLEDQGCGQTVLKGHIAKANPLWRECVSPSAVLVIFQGADSYVSPSYYPSKVDNGKVVPTWNYVAVHVRGQLSFIHDNDWKLSMLNVLTDKQEKNEVNPWSVSDAPKEFTQKLLSGIVGLEIEVESIFGKWKASQNQSHKNQQGVIEKFSESMLSSATDMAGVMQNYLSKEEKNDG